MDTTVLFVVVLEVFAVISFLAAVYLQYENEIKHVFFKVSEDEIIDFFKVVCKFYGLEMAEDPSHADDTHIALVIKEGLIAKHKAYGMFDYKKHAVILDATMAGKRVYMTILHELTHAWCYSVAPDIAMDLSALTKIGHLYWDSSNPIEETTRIAEHKGLDIREAWLTLVESEPVLKAVKNDTHDYMGIITFVVLKAVKTPLPAEILAKIR